MFGLTSDFSRNLSIKRQIEISDLSEIVCITLGIDICVSCSILSVFWLRVIFMCPEANHPYRHKSGTHVYVNAFILRRIILKQKNNFWLENV